MTFFFSLLSIVSLSFSLAFFSIFLYIQISTHLYNTHTNRHTILSFVEQENHVFQARSIRWLIIISTSSVSFTWIIRFNYQHVWHVGIDERYLFLFFGLLVFVYVYTNLSNTLLGTFLLLFLSVMLMRATASSRFVCTLYLFYVSAHILLFLYKLLFT